MVAAKRSQQFTRRSFIAASSGAGIVMGLGVVLPGCSREDAAGELSRSAPAKAFAPTVWFEMQPDGGVHINIAKAEMGQHVGSALARILADELGADWSKVSITYVDSDPKWGYMVTGGSWSVSTTYELFSRAGAAGRTLLVETAAKLLDADAAGCTAADGKVSGGGRSVTFAEVLAAGGLDRTYTEEELAALPIKAPADRRLIGKAADALDIPAKSRGEAVYGLDAELPGMVYAHPLVPPTRYGSRVRSVDDSAAKDIPGYLQTLALTDPSELFQGWAVVVADSFPAAMRAAEAVKVDWEAGPTAGVGEAELLAEGQKLVDARDTGVLVVDDGDVAAARESAAKVHTATYRTSTALHFTLEPQNALVEFRDGVCHVHAGNQWQSLIIPYLAKALAIPETDIVLHQYYLGGGFGRRLFGDQMIPAALAARELGKPVKLVFSRPADSRFDCVRSATVARLDASFDAAGKLTGIEHAAAAGWPTLAMAPGFLADGVDGKGKFDTFSISGADHWYTLPTHRVRAVNNELAQKTFLPGWLRAVGPGWIGWSVECFMDEVAEILGEDPVAFRLARLDGAGKNAGGPPKAVGGAKRLAAVLEDVAGRANWGAKLPAGEGLGVAVAHGQERGMPTWTACVAHVAVDPKSRAVSVKKIWQTIDCGTVVSPDGAMAQAEGATLWGLSLALHEGTAFRNGQVRDTNLDTYTPLRMKDVPELDLRFIESTEFPTGLGEPPLIAVPPAIGNAVYAATGTRVRDLPIRLKA